jgi:hypothetical protein
MTSRIETIQQAAVALTKAMTDAGKLIEAGFATYALYILPNAPPDQLREAQFAYMAGAEHLFNSIMAILEPGAEPTDKDLARMDLIANELAEWRGRLSDRVHPPQGTA